MKKELLSYCNRNFAFGNGKRIFVSEFLCVCVCVSQNLVPEFLSKNFVFGKEFLSYNRDFVFEKRIFGLIVCNRNFVFGKRIFVPEFFVCVSEFLSQNFCPRIFVFLEKELFFIVTGILKRKVFYMSKVSTSSQCIRI